jgi:hypothetical protein
VSGDATDIERRGRCASVWLRKRVEALALALPAALLAAIAVAGCGGGQRRAAASQTPVPGTSQTATASASRSASAPSGSKTESASGQTTLTSTTNAQHSTDAPHLPQAPHQGAGAVSSDPAARSFERRTDAACETAKSEVASSPAVPPPTPSGAQPSAAGQSSYLTTLAIVRRLESLRSPPQIKALYARLLDALHRLLSLYGQPSRGAGGSPPVEPVRLEVEQLAIRAGMPACFVPAPRGNDTSP